MKTRQFQGKSQQFVIYLAVLPKYRTECIELTLKSMSGCLDIFVSSAHLDRTVATGIPVDLYSKVSLHRLFGNRLFFQWGGIRNSLMARTTVVDLNPRSITAWIILGSRRIINRRSLVWGHIHPRAGEHARTAFLRKWMRRLAQGTITYTYNDAEKARIDEPGRKVWTAPNSLYKASGIHPEVGSVPAGRKSVIYVGRFESPKKVQLLLEGFHRAASSQPEIDLLLVGGGSMESDLRKYVEDHRLIDKVRFVGWVDDVDQLRNLYASSFCSVSPGFAGLGLTQSLGFGLPMVVAKDEPHAPEIELAELGGVEFFESDSAVSLSNALINRWNRRSELPNYDFSDYVRSNYSAEAMSAGLVSAMTAIEYERRDS